MIGNNLNLMLTLVFVLSVLAAPFFFKRSSAKEYWLKISNPTEGDVNTGVNGRRYYIARNIRAVERSKLFKDSYLGLTAYATARLFFSVKSNLLSESPIYTTEVMLMALGVILPIIFLLLAIREDRKEISELKNFQKALRLKNQPIMQDVYQADSVRVASLSDKLFTTK